MLRQKNVFAFLAANAILGIALNCSADWVLGDNSHSVNVSGHSSGTSGRNVWVSDGSADASADAGSSGVSVGGGCGSGVSMLAPDPTSTLTVGAFANASASASYSWDGPWGYPNGPESFSVHISVSLSGASTNSGAANGDSGGAAQASSQGNTGGEVDISEYRSDPVSPFSGSAGVDGYGSSSPSAVNTAHVFGDYGDSDPTYGTDGNDSGWYEGWAWFSVSFDEDYTFEDVQLPPQVTLSASMSADVIASVTVSGPLGNAEAGCSASAGISGGASATFN